MASTSPHVFIVGEVLTAANTNAYLGTSAAVLKTSTQSVTSSTTLVNDTDLALTVGSNINYAFQFFFLYQGGTQGSSDMKFQWNVPAGATLNYSPAFQSLAGTSSVGGALTAASVRSVGTSGAGNPVAVTGVGSLQTVGTAGTLQLQWAQNTSSGTATQMLAGSWAAIQQYS